jgi:hypothetical protein
MPQPDELYCNESGTTDGAQLGDNNPTGITDTTPAFSAKVYPQEGNNITQVQVQVCQDPDFPDTDIEWDSGWIELGTDDVIDQSDADTDGAVRTRDIIYGEQ